MSDSPAAPKARTNWQCVVWPILALWIACWVYVQHSEFRSQAVVAMPVLMAASALLVLLLNAIAGSVAQTRLDTQFLDDTQTSCEVCGTSEQDVQIIDYESYVFLGAFTLTSRLWGKYCRRCAGKKIDALFRRTLWGSILCPPLILYAWYRRGRELNKFAEEHAA